MTENEAIEELKNADAKIATILLYTDEEDWKREKARESIALQMAIKALEELQMYKKGGLCLIPSDAYRKQCEELDAYKEIGTVEDIQEVISFIDLDDEHGIIDDLELLNKYRLLGTVEEFKALKEKNTPKKPIPNKPLKEGAYIKWTCPNCGKMRWCGYYQPPLTFDKVCTDCLQAIDWQ